MTLTELLERSAVTAHFGGGDPTVGSIEIDSRRIQPGGLFICMPGMSRPSEQFIANAAAAGAKAALVSTDEGALSSVEHGLAFAKIDPNAFPESIWRICSEFHDHPTRSLKVLGVTGTNGKTTTAWIVKQLLEQLGVSAAYLGTLGFAIGHNLETLENTTPFSADLYNLLAKARDAGMQAITMEVSSHALAQRRVDGVEFDAAVFTNFTQDHLDYHGTMDEYAAAKHRLFTELPSQTKKRFVGAFNIDDPRGLQWSLEQNGPSLTYSTNPDSDADLVGIAREVRVDRIAMSFVYGEEETVSFQLGGAYNVENALSAVAGMLAMGFSLKESVQALSIVRPVPGRFETIANDRGIGILVDYAHTPDALEKLLDSVHQVQHGRIITVFGCGGDRDTNKRPKMAAVAGRLSDLTVVTSDNPRTEDPQSILDMVVAGIPSGKRSVAILDRREAVNYAIAQAESGDVVVVAGKGHEDYQIIGKTKIHMDDRELVRDALGTTK